VILGGVERGLLPATANAFSLPTSAFLIAHALFIFSVAILLNLALRNMEESLANTLRALTERRKLERELQEERDFVLQIINTMGQGLFMIDEKGHFMMVNPAYARLTGYELQDLLGKSPADITALEDQETLAQAREAREQGNTTTYENRLKRKDGKFIPVLITGVPRLKDGKYAGSIAVITI
jgi:PAS domain S-box-containing protein